MQGDAFDHVNPSIFQGLDFFGVVGQQFDRADAQIFVDRLRQTEIAGIDGQPECQIGFNRIHTLVLQMIGADFVNQPDAASFLTQIDDDAAPLCLYRPHGRFKLRSAVAFSREQRIARQAFGVDARQNRIAV
ncbi:Uncharacterised protein [Neisseria meningitidis]|nr:Uncharacterised protein [Neisseria meningitidis]CWS11756.1 Uncharacterised protein [Neisseria meningitidis]CWT15803.1 Uncharacterised protein [Neisseria meningitidis]